MGRELLAQGVRLADRERRLPRAMSAMSLLDAPLPLSRAFYRGLFIRLAWLPRWQSRVYLTTQDARDNYISADLGRWSFIRAAWFDFGLMSPISLQERVTSAAVLRAISISPHDAHFAA